MCLLIVPGLKHRVFFHLNHPIRFVCVSGPIVAFGDVYKKHALFYIDDGSGQNIAIKICLLLPEDVTPQAPSNTTVSNLNISTSIGTSAIQVDDTILDIGTVVKLKCTIELFRDSKQLVVQRAVVLKSTTEEAQEWNLLAKWSKDLSKPWILQPRELAQIERQEMKKQQRQNAIKAKRLEIRRARDRLRHEKEAKWEIQRLKDEMAMNSGALI
jgi:telomere regulation protein Stn1